VTSRLQFDSLNGRARSQRWPSKLGNSAIASTCESLGAKPGSVPLRCARATAPGAHRSERRAAKKPGRPTSKRKVRGDRKR